MADNVVITAGSGTTVHADEYTHSVLGSGKTQLVKVVDGVLDSETPLKVVAEDAALSGGEAGVLAMVKRNDTPANLSGTDGDAEYLQVSGGGLWVKPLGKLVTVSVDITRPADTTAYAINDALANSTTTPTTGGFTLANSARISGGSGLIVDAIITSSADPGTTLQGEIWLFEQAVTAINDNAAFAVSDSEIKTYVGKIPFTLEDSGNNDSAHVTNLAMGFTCIGSADLRFLVKVKNAYTPANAEVITVRLKILQVD